MLTFAVMPCLDEVDYVGEAVRSLLEPTGGDSSDLMVIVVDNGSTDGTLDVLADVTHRYPGRIMVEAEHRRGYVPPRRRGVAVAARIASEMSVPDCDVLILQSDADTTYRSGYVGAMRGAAASAPGAILEGSIGRPPTFEAEHPTYVEAERTVDSAVESLEAADEDDVVVDDKVCAYRLSDYISWGGLFEEWSDVGDPIHAETTRMFIRARLRGGTPKVRVNRAGAFPSRRRVLENPRYHFATLGFPRERAWADRVASGWSASDVDAFARMVLAGHERQAVALRVHHLLALFRFLPAIILAAMGSNSALLAEPDVAAALELVPRRKRDELAERPALAILDALGLIDEHPEAFQMEMR
ncbi:glycosyltransferase family 2 protein [Sphingomonas sp. NPDC079357]|uniref:glycosyltransferase family 2 protein n=1 Tax=Sphingomonas sp. NPDC079357 TaxID=3364518 RepID=UPI00384F6D5F